MSKPATLLRGTFMKSTVSVAITAILLSLPVMAEEGDVVTTGTVVVSATKTLIEVSEVVEELEVIPSEVIENSGASTTEELLRTVPGITVVKHPQTQIEINGMEGAYTLVLIDGVPIHADVGGGVPIENIPLGDIERIEVVKGSAAAIYGSSALGGVVNFITKPLSRATQISGSYRYQTNLLSSQFDTPGFENDENFQVATANRARWAGAHIADLNLRTTVGLFDIKAAGGVHYDAGVIDTIIKRPIPVFGERPYWTMNEMKRYYGNLYAGLDVNDDLTISMDTRFAYDKDKRSLSQDLVQWFENNSYSGTLRSMYFAGDNVTFDSYFSFQRFDHDYCNWDYNTEVLTTDSYSIFDTWDCEAKSEIELNDEHDLVVGVNYLHESVENEDIIDGVKSGYEFAGYAQESFNLHDESRFIITAGLRGTYNSRFSGDVNPKLGARYNFAENFYLRLAMGTGFKAPSFKQNYYDSFIHPKPQNFLLTGNPDLVPERSLSFNGSTGGVFGAFDYELYGHYTTVDDKITTMITSEEGGFTPDSTEYSYQRSYVNVAESRSWGGDFSIGYNGIDYLDLTGTVTYLYMEDRESREDEYRESEMFSPLCYKLSMMLDLTGYNRYYPLVNLMYNFEGEQIWYRDPTGVDVYLDDYSTLNMSLKERITDNVSFTFGMNNLLDNSSDDLGFGYGRITYADIQFTY
ncbi:hypothetical protein CSA37_08750 [Candidatus Fermentibacteria bacterium]|nr:MAG: hypothetical protein CSA37_08750 [Candidatus Fermentibacteria bacterium]